jgi:hypothetical protein
MSYFEESMSANAPSQEALEAGLANFKPRPSERFYRRLATAPWLPAARSTPAKRKPSQFYKWTIAALAGVTLCLGLSTTSCGRRLADQAFKLFVHAESDTRPLSMQQTPGTPTPPHATPEYGYTELSISELKTQLGFDLKEPTVLPDQFYLDQTFVFYRKNQVNFIYQFKGESAQTLFIYQQPVSLATPAMVGPEAPIIEVQIGGVKGEYVEGAYAWRPGETVETWRSDLSQRTLLWIKDGIRFGIDASGIAGQPGYVDLAEMIAIAEGMK